MPRLKSSMYDANNLLCSNQDKHQLKKCLHVKAESKQNKFCWKLLPKNTFYPLGNFPYPAALEFPFPTMMAGTTTASPCH